MWNEQKRLRQNILSEQLDMWSKKPQKFLQDMQNPDFDVLNWETVYHENPLWFYLFFDHHAPFKPQDCKPYKKVSPNDTSHMFIAFCQTRDMTKAVLPSSLSSSFLELSVPQPLSNRTLFLANQITMTAIKWASHEEYIPALKTLIKLVDIWAEKSTSQYQGALAHGLRQAVFEENFPEEIKKWWLNQHSTIFYSASHKTVTSLPEMMLHSQYMCEGGVFQSHLASAFEDLIERRFKANPSSPVLLLPTSLKLLEHFKNSAIGDNNQEYQAFMEKILIQDATKSWPFQERVRPVSNRKM